MFFPKAKMEEDGENEPPVKAEERRVKEKTLLWEDHINSLSPKDESSSKTHEELRERKRMYPASTLIVCIALTAIISAFITALIMTQDTNFAPTFINSSDFTFNSILKICGVLQSSLAKRTIPDIILMAMAYNGLHMYLLRAHLRKTTGIIVAA